MPPKNNNSNMSLEDVRYRVHKVSTLGWAGDDYAQELLNRAVKYGNIILARHKWRAIHVMEFFPRGENLLGLNVNMGEEIKVRLRKSKPKAPPAKPKPKRAPARGKRGRNANNTVTTAATTTTSSTGGGGGSNIMTMDTCPRMTFYSFEEILCTLIHEIVHCTISPHNAAFWKLYHELVAEVEQIQMEEYRNSPGGNSVFGSGAAASPASVTTPFGGEGQRLGGGGRGSNGQSILFQPGNSSAAGGGRVLGGGSRSTGASPLTYEERRAQIAAVLTQKYGAMQSPLSETDLLALDNPELNPYAASAFDAAVDDDGASPMVGRLTQVASERQNRGCGLTQPCPHTAVVAPSSAFEKADPASPLREVKQEPGTTSSAVQPEGTKSNAENWICAECGFSNHILLPYCEMCCGIDDPPVERDEGDVDEDSVVDFDTGEDEHDTNSSSSRSSSDDDVEEILSSSTTSASSSSSKKKANNDDEEDDGVIVLD